MRMKHSQQGTSMYVEAEADGYKGRVISETRFIHPAVSTIQESSIPFDVLEERIMHGSATALDLSETRHGGSPLSQPTAHITSSPSHNTEVSSAEVGNAQTNIHKKGRAVQKAKTQHPKEKPGQRVKKQNLNSVEADRKREMNRLYAQKSRQKRSDQIEGLKERCKEQEAIIEIYKKAVSILYSRETGASPTWAMHKIQWFPSQAPRHTPSLTVECFLPNCDEKFYTELGNHAYGQLHQSQPDTVDSQDVKPPISALQINTDESTRSPIPSQSRDGNQQSVHSAHNIECSQSSPRPQVTTTLPLPPRHCSPPTPQIAPLEIQTQPQSSSPRSSSVSPFKGKAPFKRFSPYEKNGHRVLAQIDEKDLPANIRQLLLQKQTKGDHRGILCYLAEPPDNHPSNAPVAKMNSWTADQRTKSNPTPQVLQETIDRVKSETQLNVLSTTACSDPSVVPQIFVEQNPGSQYHLHGENIVKMEDDTCIPAKYATPEDQYLASSVAQINATASNQLDLNAYPIDDIGERQKGGMKGLPNRSLINQSYSNMVEEREGRFQDPRLGHDAVFISKPASEQTEQLISANIPSASILFGRSIVMPEINNFDSENQHSHFPSDENENDNIAGSPSSHADIFIVGTRFSNQNNTIDHLGGKSEKTVQLPSHFDSRALPTPSSHPNSKSIMKLDQITSRPKSNLTQIAPKLSPTTTLVNSQAHSIKPENESGQSTLAVTTTLSKTSYSNVCAAYPQINVSLASSRNPKSAHWPSIQQTSPTVAKPTAVVSEGSVYNNIFTAGLSSLSSLEIDYDHTELENLKATIDNPERT